MKTYEVENSHSQESILVMQLFGTVRNERSKIEIGVFAYISDKIRALIDGTAELNSAIKAVNCRLGLCLVVLLFSAGS